MDGFVFLSYSVNWYPLGFVSVQLANAISGPFLDGRIVPYIFSFSKALSSGFILSQDSLLQVTRGPYKHSCSLLQQKTPGRSWLI